MFSLGENMHQGTYAGQSFSSKQEAVSHFDSQPPPDNNAAPGVSIVGGNKTISDTDGLEGEFVSFSAFAIDTDGSIISTKWFINGDQVATSTSPTINIPDGTYTVQFQATDDDGATSSASVLITVEAPIIDYAYNRDDYLASWGDFDGDCIDTRHEVLAIESIIMPTFTEDGCRVVAGLWQDPYTGESFTDPGELDIDHLVPLKEAHDSGAKFWQQESKRAFANDVVIADALIAVDAGANRSKGADDPARWLPPNSEYHCEYVRDWVAVKNAYGLDFDAEEVAAIESVLGEHLHHATRPTQHGINLDGTASTALLSLGMTINNGCPYYTQAAAQDLLDISVSITPEEGHIGKSFDIFLVAQVGTQLYSVSPAGELIPIDMNPNQLLVFESGVFQETYEFRLYEGYLEAPLDVQIFVAYWPDGGELIYSPTPIRLIIE